MVGGVVCLTAVQTLFARPPLAVELVSFTAVGLANGVELRWETATEQSASGFLLQRAQGDDYIDLTQLVDENGQPYDGGLIEAEGSPTFGAIYIARDLTAVPGQTYTYILLEVESDNNITAIAEATTLAGATATPTQLTIGSTATPATPAAIATATQTTSATAQSPTTAATITAIATSARTIITPTPATSTTGNELPAQPATPANNLDNNNSDSAGNNSANPPLLPTPTESGIVEVAQTQPTPASAYPGQTTPPVETNGYPEAIITPLTVSATETPYPANSFIQEQQPTPTIIGVIGSQTNRESGTAVPPTTANTSASSTGILWLGFLVGLLIFGAAVVGSIALFVRRRQ